MADLGFLLQVVAISLSGVLAPGPLSAAAVAFGLNSPNSGLLVAMGHGIVEWPLMFLIAAGLVRFLGSQGWRVALSLSGGALLAWMGLTMLAWPQADSHAGSPYTAYHPLAAGVVLTAGNPYFLLWWATIGLKLSCEAWSRGLIVFCLFAVTHWLCDAVWLGVLSWASFKGGSVFGLGSRRYVLAVCGVIMLVFAVKFVINGLGSLANRETGVDGQVGQ